ncbi:L-glutamate gamma-semialdehyde dehydrogenase [Pontibacter sp. G13]|uniref:L-glutamate gamma-semialdehyde dehydrogenase n=1 Tax=Pontibacter sp. G13 TaxID=3074898 RepID=UPI00288AB02C|nr:L-glutamate gamma-semialdehyde dehydrogenase [Pontibacter sp. G13]WNJ20164.1 L-glutamate gamma-semialdehyde dehydrogenase [Pontibacter sp. G13]
MQKAFFQVPVPENEPVLNYAPGSTERAEVKRVLADLSEQELDIPMYIGSEEVRTEDKRPLSPPHNHQHVIGHYSRGTAAHVQQAIDAALEAKPAWEAMSWEHRAAIFLKAADLLSGPWRAQMNAGTMLAQSKNIYQAEIDAVAELCDFFRFNVAYMQQIYEDQPYSPPGQWNRMEYRALEGFVFCITPFNFTSIAANLPAAAALMGNVCVWKPADSQIYSAHFIMELLKEAGLPDGVINMVYVDGPDAGDVVFKHPEFAGLHFTGSTKVFQHLWKTIGENIHMYKSYPRIVGETGGKDFIVIHPSADADAAATAISRGAFEFQGQKCSAASRVYLPASLADHIMEKVQAEVESFKMGDPADFRNFINAVIDERAFDKISNFIDRVKEADDAEIAIGGNYDKSKGYFIEPTVVMTSNPKFLTMCEEIFGPVVTIFTYEDDKWEETLELVNTTSPYALTGAIFSQDRHVIDQASRYLQHAAGNYYINDKPTGAVVGQQPFGGGRASGTNDKAGSYLNLLRWVSPRTIKETFVPAKDYRYPFLDEE